MGSPGCVVHVGVHRKWVMLWVATTHLLLNTVSVVYVKDVECTSSAESVWHAGVCCAANFY